MVKLQRDKDDIIMFHPFTTNHSCIITTSRGLSQKAWKEENVLQSIHFEQHIFCNLTHQATKQMHMGCFGTYKQQLYVYVYFKWASKTPAIYKYSNISRQLTRAYNTKEFNLSLTWIFFIIHVQCLSI